MFVHIGMTQWDGSVDMIDDGSDSVTISSTVYIPDTTNIDAYQAEIRAIYMGIFSVPLAAVSIYGPTSTYYYEVVVSEISPDLDIESALVEVEMALAQSEYLPEGTTTSTASMPSGKFCSISRGQTDFV